MLIKYLDMTLLVYDLYTLFIEESSNMRGQLSCYHSDNRLLNIHHALSRLVPKVNVKGTEPCLPDLPDHYTIR